MTERGHSCPPKHDHVDPTGFRTPMRRRMSALLGQCEMCRYPSLKIQPLTIASIPLVLAAPDQGK
jgi:hypothetical protein